MPEPDAFAPHVLGQPVVLIQAKANWKWKIRTDPDEHPPPIGIVEVEVIVIDPAFFVFQVPPVLLLVPDRGENACRFPRLENAYHVVLFGSFEIGIQHFVPACFRILNDGRAPVLRPVLDPVVKLRRDIAQNVATDRIQFPVGPEESDNPSFFLEGLNGPVQ